MFQHVRDICLKEYCCIAHRCHIAFMLRLSMIIRTDVETTCRGNLMLSFA